MRSSSLIILLLSLIFNIIYPIQDKSFAMISNKTEINIYLPGAEENTNILKNFENDLGIKFNSAKWYLDWSDPFTPDIAKRFYDHRAIPELTWQPKIGEQGIAYSDVLSGKYDSYIDSYIRSIKSLNFSIRIALGPEMNASWTPWGVDNSGNTPTNQKLFWRYVINRFASNSVTNVSWIWAPNVHFWDEKYSYKDLYPGNEYVDYLGLDGYNWGTSQPSWKSEWQTFREIFQSSYNDLVEISDKPIIITETASSELGGNKAFWITTMFNDLKNRFPQIKGLTWFNINKETDWRIESSASSKTAFINGVNSIWKTSSAGKNWTYATGQSQKSLTNTSPTASNNLSPSLSNNSNLNQSKNSPNQLSLNSSPSNSQNNLPSSLTSPASTSKLSSNYFKTNNIIIYCISTFYLLLSFLLFLYYRKRQPLSHTPKGLSIRPVDNILHPNPPSH